MRIGRQCRPESGKGNLWVGELSARKVDGSSDTGNGQSEETKEKEETRERKPESGKER